MQRSHQARPLGLSLGILFLSHLTVHIDSKECSLASCERAAFLVCINIKTFPNGDVRSSSMLKPYVIDQLGIKAGPHFVFAVNIFR